MKGTEEIRKSLNLACEKIAGWKENYMQIPKGKAGKTLITKVSHLIGPFYSSKRWEPATIHMLQVHLPLLLQKPSPKSKNREHVKYLNKWNGGNTDS